MCIYRDALYILLCSVCIQYTCIHTYIDIMCYPVVLHPVEVNPVHPPRDRFQGGISFAVSVSSSESPRFDSYQYMSSISKGRLEIEGATTHFKSQTQPTPISSHPALYYYKSKIRLKNFPVELFNLQSWVIRLETQVAPATVDQLENFIWNLPCVNNSLHTRPKPDVHFRNPT